MPCIKCGYSDKREVNLFGKNLCSVCATFAPKQIHDFQKYAEEKIDWKLLDTFRKYGQSSGQNQRSGMEKKAKLGLVVTRPPLGYDIIGGDLVPNENASKVHSLFKTFLNRPYSLNSLAKNFSLSVNGIKKILSNRTYLGEIKFNKRIYKGHHEPIISSEIFYAVGRKLKEIERPRKIQPTRYK